MKILTWFPLAYARDLKGSGVSGQSNWFRIVVSTSARDPLGTFAHERAHTSYRWRHPLKVWTVAGREETEEISHAISALMGLRSGLYPSFEEGCNGQALNCIAHLPYKRRGMWKAAYADSVHPDNVSGTNYVGAARLAALFRARRETAEAWIARHENLLDRVADRL